jgi:transposase
MEAPSIPSCPRCQDSLERLDALQKQVESLQATVAQLQRQLAAARKNSSTSSKPPSSDIVKPPKASPSDGAATCARGGQPGHAAHERQPFPPELLNGGIHPYRLSSCPTCGHDLLPVNTAPRVVQQVEILDIPLRIEEHQGLASWCSHCCCVHYAPLPEVIQRGGLVGPRLTAVIAFLKGACHASFSTIRKFLRDVAGVTISRGQLSKILGKVTEALEGPYEELLAQLRTEEVLNVDETGHKDNGKRWWTWCFRAGLYTLFKIDPTRSSAVLLEVLGEEFEGVLGCDYFSAYRRYMREWDVLLQFCLAHLIREVRFLMTLPDAKERAHGEKLAQALKDLFAVIHQRESLASGVFQSRLEAARAHVLRVGTQGVPAGKHSQNLAKRLERHGECYFRFVTTPGVEPTNNLAEQAIRFVVIDRQITQGTRSAGGRRWCERIWTVVATCCQQGRSVFEYLYQAVVAHFQGTAVPSLVGSEE